MKLTPNFSLSEFTASDAARRAKIANMPNVHEVARLRRLALGLEFARYIVKRPIRVYSGFRCEEVNALVGGVPDSDHRHGDAADIGVDGMSARELAVALAEGIPVFDQIILEADRGVVHISFADRYRRQVLQQLKKGGKVIPL